MAVQHNDESRFGGEYMIQDHDHMAEIPQGSSNARRGNGRQSEQSHSSDRQQGGGERHSQKGERRQME